ncbi:MAG: sulfatase-like hydrolase/transferase [Tannerellaceae bacterium]|jgi:phosphoglycerol transferase MdoB-like AlkP superfamily enzyme|nr:sulfatase-like hydrolase/transferase [Tannerellaceae bacterium]
MKIRFDTSYFSLQMFRLAAVLALIVLMQFLYRAVFLLAYGAHTGWELYLKDLPFGLFQGLRTDLQAGLYVLLPLTAVALLSGFTGRNFLTAAGRICAGIASGLYAGILLTDFYYYRYFGGHFSTSVFGIVYDDTESVLQSIREDYPLVGILLFFFALSFVLWRLTGRIYRCDSFRRAAPKRSGHCVALLMLPAAALLMRGSTGTFPLRNHDAMVSKHSFVNMVCMNPLLSLKDAWSDHASGRDVPDAAELLRGAGYTSEAEAVADFLGVPVDSLRGDPSELLRERTADDAFLRENPPHVVFLQMESMGTNGLSLQSDSLDVLGRLKEELPHCLYFRHFLPYTAESTIGSLEGLLISNPSAYVTQSAMENRQAAASAVLPFREAGYVTRFVTGSKQGWRNIHSFLPAQGFDFVEGQEAILHDVPGAEIQDWGVFDGYMFQQILLDLERASSPCFIYGMSITNHSPHRLPSGYRFSGVAVSNSLKGRLLDDAEYTYRGLATFRYANDCLADFIRAVRTGPLADRVIIAVTGDHPFKGFLKPRDGDLYDKYGVPFILFVPPRYLKGQTPDTSRRGSHRDIFPTLFHLSLPDVEYYRFGSNLLDAESAPAEAFSPGNALIGDSCAIDLQTGFRYLNRQDSTFVLHDDAGLSASLERRYRVWATLSRYVLLRSFNSR